MVYVKKGYKKQFKRKYRKYQKKAYKSMSKISKSLIYNQQIQFFKRKVLLQAVPMGQITSGPGPYTSSFYGMFQAIPNAGEYAALYKMYKINGIKMEWVFPWDITYDSTSCALSLHSAIDYTNSQTPITTLQALQEMGSYKRFDVNTGNRTWTRYFKPRMSQPIDTNVVGTYSKSSHRSEWINFQAADSGAVIHHGLQIQVTFDQVSPPATPGQVYQYATYYFACRYTR